MKYRIIKRSFSDGVFYYLVQSKWWIFPWRDDVGYSTNQYYFFTIEQAEQRLRELQVKQLRDVVVE